MTIAQTIVKQYSKRNMTAAGIIEVIANENLASTEYIGFHHREIKFNDGSWIIATDTTAARSIGLTNYDYALRVQDYAC
ncbi:TPA: hypothetical protein MDV85_004778 [Klebsiella pneumoniae]|jgi:hypothetical protein|nr:hypothetical protein [Klebsiella pneumoniae]